MTAFARKAVTHNISCHNSQYRIGSPIDSFVIVVFLLLHEDQQSDHSHERYAHDDEKHGTSDEITHEITSGKIRCENGSDGSRDSTRESAQVEPEGSLLRNCCKRDFPDLQVRDRKMFGMKFSLYFLPVNSRSPHSL